MARILILLAHPGQRHSQNHVRMAAAAKQLDDITLVDLYAEYPRMKIDVEREQDRLRQHDIIVFQFPVFWYSTPSLLKEWQDLVLEHGFAYGTGGSALKGKYLLIAATAGSPVDAYTENGQHRFSLRQSLTPLEQMASLCKLQYLPPFVLYAGLHARETGTLFPHINAYTRLLRALRDDQLDFRETNSFRELTADTVSQLLSTPAIP